MSEPNETLQSEESQEVSSMTSTTKDHQPDASSVIDEELGDGTSVTSLSAPPIGAATIAGDNQQGVSDDEVQRLHAAEEEAVQLRCQLENTPVTELIESKRVQDPAEESTSSSQNVRISKWKKLALVGAVLAVVIIVAVVVSVVLTRDGGGSTPSSTPEYTYATVEGKDQVLFLQIKDAYKDRDIDTSEMLRTDHYQYKAFKWLTENRDVDLYDRTQRLQRYALACLWYSTYQVPTEYTPDPEPWASDNLWMTNEPECLWAGISCEEQDDGKVTHIVLENNNLSGKLPPELLFMRNAPLRMLDVTSNRIFMDEDEMDFLFGQLSHLHTLDIDDNFFSCANGLPQSMTSLTKLEMLKASYNLMAGPLDNGVLQQLTKLTHLEIENNFFTGALHFLGNMPSLIYVYLRRNDLNDAHLNFMKTGQLTNLFSIWLDGQEVSQSIPSQIGRLTNLASLSIADCSLTGTIPTEMGSLPKLNRVWLYGNQLVGTVPTEITNLTKLQVFEVHENNLHGKMPSGVCEVIQDSDYDQKSLSADCDQVSCNDCCTKCEYDLRG